jgi:hypothetical protein
VGEIRTFVKQVYPLSGSQTAYRHGRVGTRVPGKTVIDLRAGDGV